MAMRCARAHSTAAEQAPSGRVRPRVSYSRCGALARVDLSRTARAAKASLYGVRPRRAAVRR